MTSASSPAGQSPTTRHDGRTAVVIGVGSPIGRACAHRLTAEGAAVLAVDPDAGVAAEVAASAPGPGSAVAHTADLHGEASAAGVADRCAQLWGGLDVLAHCGSAMDVWPLAEDSLERWSEVLTVNLLGPVAYTRALQPLLATSGHGAVVYLGSIDGLLGNPNLVAYSMGKGGLTPLTHTMAVQLAPQGIRVNCVAAAGLVQIGSGVGAPQRELGCDIPLERLTPLGRRPEADELAAVIAFLASDEASYVTGTVLPVDGGRMAATPATW